MELIICSSIWYKDLKLKRPDILDGFRPVNVDRGVVFSGWRHPNCMYQMCAIFGLRSVKSEVGEFVQGFTTSKNRFVDRKEGYLISKLSNQLKDDFEGKDTLFSEDIY